MLEAEPIQSCILELQEMSISMKNTPEAQMYAQDAQRGGSQCAKSRREQQDL